MDTTSIIEKLNLIHVEVHGVSGTVSKTEESQDDVFTNGSVRYLDKKHLRVFSRIRQKANRICRQHGTRFLDAWATPDEAMGEIRSELSALELEAATARNELVANLRAWRDEWALAHPEIAPYRARFPSDQQIVEQVSMSVSIFKILPQQFEGIEDGIATEVGGLAGQALSEIANDIRDSFSAKAQMAKSASRDILARFQTKLERFAFVDSRLQKVADLIGKTLALLPASGPIRGQAFITFSGLTSVLSDPATALDAAEQAAATTDTSDAAAFLPFLEAASPAAEVDGPKEPPVMTPPPPPTANDFLRDHFAFVSVGDEQAEDDEAPPPAPVSEPKPAVEDHSAWNW